MGDRALVESRLRSHALSPHHAETVANSFSKLRPPYHNEAHCYSTALTFHELAQRAHLPKSEARLGFLAALYHDAGHLQASDDGVNIQEAVELLSTHVGDELSTEELATTVAFLRSTHNRNHSYSSLTEKLIHDADILQTVKGSLRENIAWQKRLARELATTITLDGSVAFVLQNLSGSDLLRVVRNTLISPRLTSRLARRGRRALERLK